MRAGSGQRAGQLLEIFPWMHFSAWPLSRVISLSLTGKCRQHRPEDGRVLGGVGGALAGSRAPALFRVLWCRAMRGSHSSSTVHLHGYLGPLKFQDDIYGHVWRPTHTSWARTGAGAHVCLRHKCVPRQLKPGATHDEGATEGRSHAAVMRFHWY